MDPPSDAACCMLWCFPFSTAALDLATIGNGVLMTVVARRCQRPDRLLARLAWLKTSEKSEAGLPRPRSGWADFVCTKAEIELRMHDLTVIYAGVRDIQATRGTARRTADVGVLGCALVKM